jgi:AAA family ATPase
MRPGRFDRSIYVGPPDHKGREEILRICMSSMRVEQGIEVREIAQIVRQNFFGSILMFHALHLQAEGCSGAELSSLCQEAALLTMRHNMDAQFVCAILCMP